MLGSGSVLRTKEGLRPMAQLSGNTTVWSGANWVDAVVGNGTQTPGLLEVRMLDNCVITALPDAMFLAAGRDGHFWRPARKLVKGDYLCTTLSDSGRLRGTYGRMAGYWLGVMFGGGVFDHAGCQVALEAGRAELNAKMAKDAESFVKGRPIKAGVMWEGTHGTLHLDGVAGMISHNGGVVEEGQLRRVPPGIRFTTSTTRKAFCRGVIDANAIASNRSWYLDLGTEERARSFAKILRSCGVECAAVSHIVTVAQWLASLELGTDCEYPNDSDFGTKDVPEPLHNEFLEALAARKQNKYGVPPGAARLVEARLEAGKNVPPALMRAAWKKLKTTPTTPIYGQVPVMSVLPLHDEVSISSVRVASTEHTVDVNGYVVGDSFHAFELECEVAAEAPSQMPL